MDNRRQVESIISIIMRILKTTDPQIAMSSLENTDEELDEIFLWLDENVPVEYTKQEDIANAYDNLSLADVYRGRIRRWQHWRFLIYISNLLTAGVALSKKEKYPGFTKYNRSTRILKIWQHNQKNAKRNSIAEKIARKTHCSKKRVIKDEEELLYLKQ